MSTLWLLCPESNQLLVTTGDNLKWLWSAPLVGPHEKVSASISRLRPASTRLMALGGYLRSCHYALDGLLGDRLLEGVQLHIGEHSPGSAAGSSMEAPRQTTA